MDYVLAAAMAVAVLTTCAGNGTAIPHEREIGRDREEILRQRFDTAGVAVMVPRDPAHVWAVLPAAYQAVGLAPVEVEEGGGSLGVRNLRARGRLGGTRLSEFVDCGASRPGLLNADRYEIRLSLFTNSATVGRQATRLRTVLVAEAYDPLAGSSQKVLCYTTGGLEAKLYAEVDRRLMVP